MYKEVAEIGEIRDLEEAFYEGKKFWKENQSSSPGDDGKSK